MTEGLTGDSDRYTNKVASTVTEGLTGDSDSSFSNTPNSPDIDRLNNSTLARTYDWLPPLSAVITRGAGMFDELPLPPDPLFATHHGNLACPLTPEEEQRLTMSLMSVASKFDASSITQLTGVANYSDWARVCASALKSTGLARYVHRSSIKPLGTGSKDQYLWCAWDEQTAELILRTVTKDVYDQIKQDVPYSTSHQLWDGMRRLFVNSGILSQVNYLRRALRHTFPPDEPYGPTIRTIRSDLQRVYDVGSPSIDDMMSILILQALTLHHADVARAIENSNAIDHRSIQR
ncbi:hypothetical protein EW146_g8373 [Bondarzewia mesenterica]|uniref:Uncharacterized protein n=1 Tax=Bondarzewia mesenterica TaxID=1095465 RepID=A0A4S4LGN4_9AGAM|nr:hypothetical protein EW146_g8373 [Bondarzewia mesenterica]